MERIRLKSTRPKLISLFSGMGGLDFGFEAAGFETCAALEFNKHACDTMRLNRKWPVIESDINKVPSKDILNYASLKKGEVDVLIGGPPCQPFSSVGASLGASAGNRKHGRRGMDDPRASMLTHYLRVLRDVQPRAFLIENVAGIAQDGKNEGMKYIFRGVDRINRETGSNYKINWRLINVAEHGVPQLRKRVFMIGARDGRSFTFPISKYGSPGEIDNSLFSKVEPYRTAWDGIGDLKEPTASALHELNIDGFYGDILPSIPEGQSINWHMGIRRSGTRSYTASGNLIPQLLFDWQLKAWFPSVLRKLAKHLPSWTILAQYRSYQGPLHWKNRHLTFQEMCRLQTFPDGLEIDCNKVDGRRLLGNAVPSLMAEILAREIRSQLLGHVTNSTVLKLLPPKRANMPLPEPFTTLPFKYCRLIDPAKVYGREIRREVLVPDWFHPEA